MVVVYDGNDASVEGRHHAEVCCRQPAKGGAPLPPALGEEEVENTNDDRTSAALLPLPARLERLYVDLFERGYVGISDVHAAQLWLKALVDVDYPFPEPVK